MLHEDPEADIVREDGLPLRPVGGVVRYRWVELGDEETGLRLVLVAHDVSVAGGRERARVSVPQGGRRDVAGRQGGGRGARSGKIKIGLWIQQ